MTAADPDRGPLAMSSQNVEAFELLADAVAARVVALLGVSGPAPHRRPLTAREVAERLGRSVDWVRDHRFELGVLPATGARPRLLFDPVTVAEFTTARMASERSTESRPPTVPIPLPHRQRPRKGDGVELLPIRDSRSKAA